MQPAALGLLHRNFEPRNACIDLTVGWIYKKILISSWVIIFDKIHYISHFILSRSGFLSGFLESTQWACQFHETWHWNSAHHFKSFNTDIVYKVYLTTSSSCQFHDLPVPELTNYIYWCCQLSVPNQCQIATVAYAAVSTRLLPFQFQWPWPKLNNFHFRNFQKNTFGALYVILMYYRFDSLGFELMLP